MITTRRALPVAAALVLALTACGGGSSDESAEIAADTTVEGIADDAEDFTEVETADSAAEDVPAEEVPAEEAPADEVPAEEVPAEDAPAETAAEPADAPAETSGDATVGAPASSAEVSLVEWAIEAPTEYAAGEVTFNASNDGSFPHEFVVIEGQGYEALPLADGGAVIEDDLPTGALIGRTGRVGGGSSEVLTVTLAPGNYVLVCNLGGGGNSHAGQGQRLDITVS